MPGGGAAGRTIAHGAPHDGTATAGANKGLFFPGGGAASGRRARGAPHDGAATAGAAGSGVGRFCGGAGQHAAQYAGINAGK